MASKYDKRVKTNVDYYKLYGMIFVIKSHDSLQKKETG